MTQERGPRAHLSARAKARKRALDILFECDLRNADLLGTLQERVADADPPVALYAREIIAGVQDHQLSVDQRIAESLSQGWTLERMARVDRALARIAVWELDHTDTATPVIIDEAVQLASELSTDASPAFLNGMLATAARNRLNQSEHA